jgi:hypothetical protein
MDGELESKETCSYNEDYTESKCETDSNNDGIADSRRTTEITEAADGRFVAIVEIDDDADGQIDSTTETIFDKYWNVFSFSFDDDNDGVVDKIITGTYECWEDRIPTYWPRRPSIGGVSRHIFVVRQIISILALSPSPKPSFQVTISRLCTLPLKEIEISLPRTAASIRW